MPYTKEDLKEAITKYREGNVGLRKIAKQFDIPPATLWEHANNKVN